MILFEFAEVVASVLIQSDDAMSVAVCIFILEKGAFAAFAGSRQRLRRQYLRQSCIQPADIRTGCRPESHRCVSFDFSFFKKHIHIVLPPLTDVCPNRGFCPMISMIRAVGICCSFHLKMSVPFGLRTRIHSSNPCRMSSSHEGRRRPYFFASHDDSPRLFRCGGSNRTR